MICFKVKLPNLIMEHFYRRCQLWRLRIKIVSIKEGFKGCRVKIKKSFLNRNMNGTIFGGALFSASDPFYAILYASRFICLSIPYILKIPYINIITTV